MAGKTIEELNQRRAICKLCIRTIDQMDDDPRKPAAMELYKEQLARIDAEITELTGTPPANVINLKTAVLFGESELDKGE